MVIDAVALPLLTGWLSKGLIGAAVAFALIGLARRWGSGLAGLLTGLPVIGGPAVLLLAQERGAAFAHEVFEGAVVAGAVCAIYASSFALVAWLRQGDGHTHAGRKTAQALLVAGAAGLLVTVLAVALLRQVALSLPWLAVLCCWITAVCFTLLTFVLRTSGAKAKALARPISAPSSTPSSAPGTAASSPPSSVWISTGIAGVVGVLAAGAADLVGPFGAGLISSLPWLCTTLLLQLSWLGERHNRIATGVPVPPHANAAVTRQGVLSFLHGYVLGLLGRSVFVIVVAVFVASWGVAAALLVAALAAMATTQLATRCWSLQHARLA
jgi:hypothetical protein